MKRIPLSTLSLTLAVAVITLGYVNPSLAGKPNCADDDSHPSCSDGGGGEPTAQYTAALTMGGFRFAPVFVTPNKRGTSYHSVSSTLTMHREDADPDGQLAWDGVFDWCNDLFSYLEISSVFVGRDNWSITSGGRSAGSDIRIRFKDVDLEPTTGTLQSVKVYFDLIGVVGADPFLPEVGNTSVFVLDTFVIYGDARQGQSCRSPGNSLLSSPSQLEISHTD